MTEEGVSDAGDNGSRRTGGATRGFLFSDLRGYTAFVDQRGAEAAADLLDRYRALVRTAVAQYGGAEIRTEGDSFYVVFGAVSDALRCGVAIVAAAQVRSEDAQEPIRLGVGIHAGETVETAEGYVGQPINIAARLCAIAAPGEVLVSETVRSLTQAMVPVIFIPRGRRRLKGIAEPIQIYAAQRGDPRAASRGRALTGRHLLLAAVPVVALSLAALFWAGQRPAPGPTGNWAIGVSLPLSGESAARAEPLRLAVELAVADTIATGRLGDAQVAVLVSDDSDGQFEDPEQGAANAAAFVANPTIVAMIGPFSSFVAAQQIPITNEAGLLQCSSSATDPSLTKPRAGALDLRSTHPTRINFIRLPAAADIEAAAAASFARYDLGSDNTLVIDDAQPVGRLVADAFQREVEALDGTVVRRTLNPNADALDVLAPLGASGDVPTLVFFGGFTNSGGPELRRAMVDAGYGDVPFQSWDGLWDGSGEDEESFVNLAGAAAAGSYVSHPTVGTIGADFERRFRSAHGEPPPASVYEYAAAAYACTEAVLQAFTTAFSNGSAPPSVREAVRAQLTDSGSRFDTVLGNVGFDENGDNLQQVVTFFRVDPAAANGAGDWIVTKQQDFGPAP